jgi:hypothetical protein
VYIGYDAAANAATDTNEIVIGASETGGGSNTVNLGSILTATGTGTPSTSTTTVAGNLVVTGGTQVGTDTATCSSGIAGTVRYSGGVFQGCNGTSWVTFPGLQLISTQTASASASLQWTGLGSSFYYYKLFCTDIVMSANTALLLQFGEGATPTWGASGSDYIEDGYYYYESSSGGGGSGQNRALVCSAIRTR